MSLSRLFDGYADEVHAEEALWQRRSISSVLALVVNDHYLFLGGLSAAEFERSLRSIAAQLTVAEG